METLLLLIVLVGLGTTAGVLARNAGRNRYLRAQGPWLALTAASAVCFGLALLLGVFRCIVVIPPGNVGVAVLFGRVIDKTVDRRLALSGALVLGGNHERADPVVHHESRP